MTDTGYLEIFCGPMYSGKTSKLLEIYKQCKFCNITVSVINYEDDKRYHDTLLSSHDGIMIPCIQTRNIMDVYNAINKSSVILINEAQFFTDLDIGVINLLKENKKIYIAGLDGDFERKKFGKILDLLPLCDKITKLTSLCGICKNGVLGIFSMRLTGETEQTVIGADNYLPVCRNCYQKTKI